MKKPVKAVKRFSLRQRFVDDRKDVVAVVPLEKMREVNTVQAVDVPFEHVIEKIMVQAVETFQLGDDRPLKALARGIVQEIGEGAYAAGLRRTFRAEGTETGKKRARERREAGEMVRPRLPAAAD